LPASFNPIACVSEIDMKYQRKMAARVLPLLAKAGWIESSFVNDADIQVKWTKRGKRRMKSLLCLDELPRTISGPELTFMVYLAHFFLNRPWDVGNSNEEG
jgi:hypothetical protein